MAKGKAAPARVPRSALPEGSGTKNPHKASPTASASQITPRLISLFLLGSGSPSLLMMSGVNSLPFSSASLPDRLLHFRA